MPKRYAEALQFLWGRINYERQMPPRSSTGFKLATMTELAKRLGDPQWRYPVVHLAGTKGKGSTAAYLAAIFSAAGLRTGLYTSPHLHRVEERLAINGQPIDSEDLAALLERLQHETERLDAEIAAGQFAGQPATFFELITLAGWMYFADQAVDVAVVEVGLGGRLDSTNICRPPVGLITSISLDHTRQLGSTIPKIAGEKAGIIKPGMTVFSGVTQDEAQEVIEQRCRDVGATCYWLGRDFEVVPAAHDSMAPGVAMTDGDSEPPETRLQGTIGAGEPPFSIRARTSMPGSPAGSSEGGPYRIGLLGSHQVRNAALAVVAARAMWPHLPGSRTDSPGLSPERPHRLEPAIRRGLVVTRVPGRIETLSDRPTVIVDVAHNPAAMAALLETLSPRLDRFRRKVLVMAISDDKDASTMLTQAPLPFDELVFTRFVENPRALPPEQLAETWLAHRSPATDRPQHHVLPNPTLVLDWLIERVRPEDLIVVTGSTFLVAEMRQALQTRWQPVARF